MRSTGQSLLLFFLHCRLYELERNHLVKVFLCVLKYHEGDMISTAGRVQTLEVALPIHTIIGVHVQYSELRTHC